MRVIQNIDRGAFGVVDLVELDDGQRAARKTFSPKLDELRTDKFRHRFCREAQYQEHLGGPYVVPVLVHALEGEEPWYVMPLAERTLADYIRTHPVTDESWSNVLIEVMDALEHIHSMEIWHRDLKPTNVLYQGGRWKLSDFGIALPAMSTTTQVTTKGAWGTTMYMSPEQASEFHKVDHRTDIYALGCVLHDIYARSPRPRVPHQEQTCDGPMGEVIARCTKVDRTQRYDSVAEARADVLRAIRDVTPPIEVDIANQEWLEKVRGNAWTASDVADFARYLGTEPHDRETLLDELRPAAIRAMYEASPDRWLDVARDFCKRAHGGFPYDFCDVVVQGLLTIYELGGVATRSTAVHAAAELGRSHNRWHVMRQVRRMAGPRIDEALARRIVLDGKMSSSWATKHNLIRCAEGISEEPALMYHPTIAAWIAPPPPAESTE